MDVYRFSILLQKTVAGFVAWILHTSPGVGLFGDMGVMCRFQWKIERF
jgi:hypothetical protein